MPPPQTNLIWRALAEFTVPSIDGMELATTQVTAAVRNLGLSPAGLKQITQAVSEALHNAVRQGQRLELDLPLRIELFAADQGDRDTLRCWGFFVIARTADRLAAPEGPIQHVIQIYLYQEGVQPREPPA